MENFTFELINIKKRTIEHVRQKKVKKHRGLVLGVFAFFVINSMGFLAVNFVDGFNKQVAQTTFYSQNTSMLLFGDSAGILASAKAQEFNTDQVPELTLPIITRDFVIEEGAINFEVVDDVMVSASAKGIVVDVGNLANGGKFIEVKHSNQISTRYENVEVVGVVRGEVVKAGQDIATSKVGTTMKFVVLQNGEPVQNIKINQNKITWQEQA